jgi:iduronate 2-sulfatase
MVAPTQYFDPYRWQEMVLPKTIADDLADIPKLGRAGTISTTNPIGKYPDNQKRMWAAYYASVAFMDEQVGRILDELDRLGLRDQTAIVFTSDHGYHLGEHGFWQKSNLHEEVLRVPLIMSVPGMKTGRSKSIVELVDMYPTLSELAGLKIPAEVQGTSLLPILKDPQATVKAGALSFNKGYSLRQRDWHYMRYNDKTRELYDMNTDPQQFHNLAGNSEHAEIVQRLDAALNARLQAHKIKAGK